MMNARFSRIRTVAIAAAAQVVALSSTALAMDPPYCEKYARTAVLQTRAAQTSGCFTLSSRRWHTDRSKHYDWCLAASFSAVRKEWNGRTARLKRCTGGCPGHRCDEGW